jgi:hypothetical protein
MLAYLLSIDSCILVHGLPDVEGQPRLRRGRSDSAALPIGRQAVAAGTAAG